jgi:glutaconyl-CoA/methylmalonyl-CoA decarboxylase subunit gamma
MIKKVRVTVDGKPFDVTVEMPDDAPPPVSPAPSAPAAVAPQPTPAPLQAAPGDVPSPLAGHIVAVAVALGQAVKRGESLVTVEAMKMNTFVLAPADGKVTALNVKVGDVVSEGQALVRIE